MKIKIADIITELNPKYEETIKLSEPFIYHSRRDSDLQLNVSDKYLNNLMSRAAENISIGEMENFAFSCEFNRKAINYDTMLVHSSSIVFDGGAYLFSADSGSGKEHSYKALAKSVWQKGSYFE